MSARDPIEAACRAFLLSEGIDPDKCSVLGDPRARWEFEVQDMRAAIAAFLRARAEVGRTQFKAYNCAEFLRDLAAEVERGE